ncbi:Hsp70 family protein [Geodermatophilus sp. SYSU D00525]
MSAQEPGRVGGATGGPVRDGEYGLGIDIGDGTVAAAVCADDGTEAEPLPLEDPAGRPAGIEVDDHGVRLGSPARGRTAHLLARVGTTTPLRLATGPVPAAAVVAGAVQLVRAAAALRMGRPDAWTVVTVPPSWAGHRRGALAAALEEAGVPRFTLVSAAVAAVARHTGTGELPERPTVAVYDLGAATVDVAVVGPDPGDPDAGLPGHLAPPPAPLGWGGRDVDDRLVGHVRRSTTGTPDAAAAEALRRACVAAKEALSAETATRVQVGAEAVRLTREELDELVADPVRESAGRLLAAVEAAGVDPAALDAVVLTGGGARMPLVAEVLSGELGRPLTLGPAPELTVALGAAGLAAEALAADGVPGTTGNHLLPEVPVATLATVDTAPPAAVPATTRRPAAGAPPRGPEGVRRPAAGPAPARARARRTERGVLVGVLLLALLVLPPAVAGVLGTGVTSVPPGEVPVAQAEDGAAPGGGGSPGVPAPDAVRPAGAAAPGGTARSAGGLRATDSPVAAAGAVPAAGAPGAAGPAGTAAAAGSPAGTPAAGASATGTTTPGTTTPGSTTPGTTAPGSTTPGTTATGTTAGGATAGGATAGGATAGGAPAAGAASAGDPAPGTTPPGTTAPQPTGPSSGTTDPTSGPPPSGTPEETPTGTPVTEAPGPGTPVTEGPGTGTPAPDTTTPPAGETATAGDTGTPAGDTGDPAGSSPEVP